MKDEFNTSDIKEYNTGNEFNTIKADVITKKRKRNRHKAYLVTTALCTASLALFALPKEEKIPIELENDEITSSIISGNGVSAPLDKADLFFEALGNLDPNGFVPGYGIINEDFIIANDFDGSQHKVHINALVGPSENVDGLTYDEDTNTLTLENYNGKNIVTNMMGNGLKVKLVGDNYLENFGAYAFMYGGSITFVGDGTLTITSSDEYEAGIMLICENATSCIMIDKGVKLSITSPNAAIMVYDTNCTKGIYYLGKLEQDMQIFRDFYTSDSDAWFNYNQKGFYDYTFLDVNGNPAKTISFK